MTLGAEVDPPPGDIPRLAESEGRLPARGIVGGIRRHAARGTLINASFQVGFAGLNLLRRLIVAAFLTTSEFGLWGAMLASLFLVVFIKDAGFNDKFIQQSEDDQQAAFRKLFTLELIMAGIVIAIAGLAIPLFAAAYGQPEIVVPGLILSLAVLGNSLQSPYLIFYRRMEFVRQRLIQGVDPVVAFMVTVALAIAGAGYWSLVIGAVVGSLSGAAVALIACPYRIRLRFQRSTVAEYFGFSWPLVAARGELILVGQASLLLATRTSGIAAAGAMALAISITQFAQGVDNIITQTIYPAVCAVRRNSALLFEAFIKSNRLALMWGMPFGVGVALFISDLVHFVIGERWGPAVVVIAAMGIATAIDQLGFNWSAFLRALDWTRPLALLAALDLIVFLVATAPLLIAFGLPGFAGAVLIAQVVRLAGRGYFLKRLFPQLVLWRHAWRAVAPIVPAVLVVLGIRLLDTGERSAELAVAELVAFVAVCALSTALFERKLIREMTGYLRRAGGARPTAKIDPATR